MSANMLEAVEWELDEDGSLIEHQPEIPEDFYASFYNCAVILARHYLDVFFTDKIWYGGGGVPKAILYSPQVVSMVLNTTQTTGIDCAYELLRKYCIERTLFPEVTNHIVYVLSFIHQCREMGVPTCFRGGLLLAMLKFCQGIPLHGR